MRGSVNAPGALSWNELATTDVEAAKNFYEGLFGWTYEDMDMNGSGTYTIVRNRDRSNGGIREQGPAEQGVPPHWLPYFGAVSVDESAGRANKLGGRVIVPTVRVPAGAFAAVADPQGAVFALFEGDFDD